MRSRLLMFSLLLVSSAWAGNGSSGIGSAKIPIAHGVFSALPDPDIRVKSGTVYDRDQPILSISPITLSALSEGWTPSQLGAVRALEYLPSPESSEKNAWIICSRAKVACSKLVPLSKDNHKIPAILGSFVRPASSQE